MKTLLQILKIIFFPITIITKIINKLFLRSFLKNVTITKIDALTGEQFEDICKLIFKYCGYKVTKTQKSNDYGADLILEKKFKIVLQAKLYYKHGVSNKAVQEVCSALKFYKADMAVVITNWHYTKQAINIAQVENVLLLNRDDIIEFLKDMQDNTKNSKLFNLENNFKIREILLP